MKKIITLAITATAFAGCATFSGSNVSNVMQIGKDSYTVRAMSAQSVSAAKQDALAAANGYCKQQGNKNVMMVNEFSGLEAETNQKYDDVTFMCLAQGDKDFTRITRDSMNKPVSGTASPTE